MYYEYAQVTYQKPLVVIEIYEILQRSVTNKALVAQKELGFMDIEKPTSLKQGLVILKDWLYKNKELVKAAVNQEIRSHPGFTKWKYHKDKKVWQRHAYVGGILKSIEDVPKGDKK